MVARASRRLLLAAVALGAATAANAATIDISGVANSNAQSYTNGGNYPLAGNSFTINGIGFTASGIGSNSNATGTVYAGGPNASFVVPVGQTGVNTAYVLLNSGFGVFGETVGSITFTAGAASQTVALTEGINLRDHYQGGFNNIATGTFGTAEFGGGVRFDAYRFVLPTGFGGALDSITLTTNANAGGNGIPFLAGITTTFESATPAVPEPSTWAMMIGGFGVAGGALRVRRRRAALA